MAFQQQQAQAFGGPPPSQYFSIDVECVATGTDHNSRSIAHIALVDQYLNVLLNLYIKQDKPVSSYLTPLTGLSKELLEQHGIPLEQAVALLKRTMPPHAILVGQNIGQDVQWLGLKEGKDFASMMDLAGLYRVWNPKYSSWSVFGQDHVAKLLLNWQQQPGQNEHDALQDAMKSMSLFLHHQRLSAQPEELAAAQQALLASNPAPSFAKRNPTFEGVCMGNRKTCTCGAPFFS